MDRKKEQIKRLKKEISGLKSFLSVLNLKKESKNANPTRTKS